MQSIMYACAGMEGTVSSECLLCLCGSSSAWLWSGAGKSETGMNWERQNPLANTDSWHSFGTYTPLTPRALRTSPFPAASLEP